MRVHPFFLLAMLAAPAHAAAAAGDGVAPYRAEFGAESVRFTLERPDGPQTLRLRLLSVGRDGEAPELPAVSARAEGTRATSYVRGTLTERYDLLPEGLEQSFVFESLPSGSGDLVVRVAVESDLPLVHAEDDVVVLGGVRIGDVFGIDADGRRTPGNLRWDAGVMELRLPAAFVDMAPLPLVLDPLVGDVRNIGSLTLIPSSSRERQIVAAYLPGADRYLAAWTEEYQDECNVAVAGRLLAPSGAPLGSVLGFLDPAGSFPCFASNPSVASSVGAQRFVLVEAGGNKLPSGYFSSIDPTTLQASKPVIVAPGLVGSIVVGGESTGASTSVVVAYVEQFSPLGIQLLQVDAIDGTVLASAPLTTFFSDTDLAISSSGGAAERYLLTWVRDPFGASDIWAAVVDHDLGVLVAPFPLVAGPEAEVQPAVDGDGDHWVVAFERTGPMGDGDILCMDVTWDALSGTLRTGAERVVEGDPGQDERNPSVAWAGESALITFSEQFSGADYDVYVRSVETFDCLDCEGEVLVANPPTPDEGLSVATQRGAGGSGSGAMLVWLATTNVTPPFSSGLRVANALARPWSGNDGSVRDLGGGCGSGGVADATCARVGAQSFGLRLEGATPSALAGVLLGLERLDLVCGPCVLVPDPTDALILPTDGNGHAEVSLPLFAPVSFSGAVFHAQWLVAGPSGCGSFSFSNALEITVD